jgi:hypothetical protein
LGLHEPGRSASFLITRIHGSELLIAATDVRAARNIAAPTDVFADQTTGEQRPRRHRISAGGL